MASGHRNKLHASSLVSLLHEYAHLCVYTHTFPGHSTYVLHEHYMHKAK